VPQEGVVLAVEELELLAAEHEADPVDGVIATCYRLVGSFERAIRDKQALQVIPRETLARSLREIANRAFTVGWNCQNLTSIQRAQILDVLLSVANLAEYSIQRRLWLHCVFVLWVFWVRNRSRLGQAAAVGLIVELPWSLCYQRRTVTRFVNQHRYRLVFGILVVLLCGLVYLGLHIPELTAIDYDISNDAFALGSSADDADSLSHSAAVGLTDDVTKDIALAMSHRGLSRARKVKAQRLRNATIRTESYRNTGRPVELLSDFTARDLLHELCIQRI
jgi:hypothetical protein